MHLLNEQMKGQTIQMYNAKKTQKTLQNVLQYTLPRYLTTQEFYISETSMKLTFSSSACTRSDVDR